ncbi:hypothetical protein SUGI_1187230 [Cryptomeria japonica]|uniref:uncharacterized protein LOC131859906 n=1 Tax=Cryptomeria japonica TaxID=3369 RepID=UPI0024147723|nr:uncharacterized protein LOC131859906 [Cryptomeria japonica]GLJ55330.1 hypothetical protein SUGI_1187230 [Cryptomeria japonica]
MSGRQVPKAKTKEDGDLVDINPRPHLQEYQRQKNVQRGVERLDRHSSKGYLGLPSKKGHGGKYTWEGPNPDGIVDLPPDALDEGDPNYIDEAQEEGERGFVEAAKAPAAPQGVARVEIVQTLKHPNPAF